MAEAPLTGLSPAEVRERWAESLAIHGRPELTGLLAPLGVEPPDWENFEIIGDADVSSSWEDRSNLPCNFCRHVKQFKSGGFYANFYDGYIYSIGPVCGSDDQKKARGIAVSRYKSRLMDEALGRRAVAFRDDISTWKARWDSAIDYDDTKKGLHRAMHLTLDLLDEFGSSHMSHLAQLAGQDGNLREATPYGFGRVVGRLRAPHLWTRSSCRQTLSGYNNRLISLARYSFNAKLGTDRAVPDPKPETRDDLSRVLGSLEEELRRQEMFAKKAASHLSHDLDRIWEWFGVQSNLRARHFVWSGPRFYFQNSLRPSSASEEISGDFGKIVGLTNSVSNADAA